MKDFAPKIFGILGMFFFGLGFVLFILSYFFQHKILMFDENGISVFTSKIAKELGHISRKDIEEFSLCNAKKPREIMIKLKKTNYTKYIFSKHEYYIGDEKELEFYGIIFYILLANKRPSTVLKLLQKQLEIQTSTKPPQ